MPDGLTHASASIIISWCPWMLLFASKTSPMIPAVTIESVTLLSAGALAGVIISPDLDVAGRTYGKAILWRSSCLVGALWVMLWWPYSQLVEHRSILSHWPIIGTIIRVGYMISVPLLVWTLLASALNWPPPTATPVMSWLLHQGRWCLIGLAISDIAHWAMDELF